MVNSCVIFHGAELKRLISKTSFTEHFAIFFFFVVPYLSLFFLIEFEMFLSRLFLICLFVSYISFYTVFT